MRFAKKNIIPGFIFILVGLFFIIPSFELGIIAKTADLMPGGGFFPLLLGSIVAVLGIVILILGIKKGSIESPNRDNMQKENVRTILFTILSILLFFAAWKLVKFYISAFLLSLSLNLIYKQGWKFAIIYSAILIGFVYLSFTVGLGISFKI